jgi:hypothetical protein
MCDAPAGCLVGAKAVRQKKYGKEETRLKWKIESIKSA